MKEVPKTNDDHNRDTEKVVTCPMLGEVVENSKCKSKWISNHIAKTNIRRKFPCYGINSVWILRHVIEKVYNTLGKWFSRTKLKQPASVAEETNTKYRKTSCLTTSSLKYLNARYSERRDPDAIMGNILASFLLIWSSYRSQNQPPCTFFVNIEM